MQEVCLLGNDVDRVRNGPVEIRNLIFIILMHATIGANFSKETFDSSQHFIFYFILILICLDFKTGSQSVEQWTPVVTTLYL